ncbi:hypothetical protein ABZ815_43650 [Nonomuraea sp. NPDC047529]|uniref:hypothetical protein n=1 Tax=Nonomuraea sp. NPDC047529 TaxID=3155623 RepID=UPI0033DB67A8
MSWTLTRNRPSPSQRRPGRMPSRAAAQPPRPSRAVRAVTSASMIRRRRAQVGSTVSRHTHSSRAAMRSGRSSRRSAAGTGPSSDSVRSSRARSGGASRTLATSSSKAASPSPSGVGVRNVAFHVRPSAARTSSAVTGSAACSAR